MAKLSLKAGTTSKSIDLFIQDSSSSTGAGLTGLVFNTASLTAYYHLPGASATSISLVTLAAVTSAYSSGGFKEIDATNMPGWYRFDIPNACLTGAASVSLLFKGATNMAPLPLEIELTAVDNQDAVRFGITALPNANAAASGGLLTFGTSTGQIQVDGAGNVKADVNKWLAGTIPAVNVTGVPVVDLVYISGSAASGVATIDANITKWNGTTVATPDTAGYPKVTIKSGTGTGELSLSSGTVTTGTNSDKTGYSLSTSQSFNTSGSVGSVTGAVGSVTGAVGSVTGAVGSVTGNLGGNVVGSVGSVAGAVGSVTGNVGGNVNGNVVGSVASVAGAVGSVTGAVGSVTGAVGSVAGNVGGNVVGNLNGSVVGAVGSVSGDIGGNLIGHVGSVVGNVGGDIAGNVNGNIIGAVGSVTGAVGSVTGAVGSVTGNVGGNVVGSVGSVATGINVSSIDGDSSAATNTKLFFNGTGYSASNSHIGAQPYKIVTISGSPTTSSFSCSSSGLNATANAYAGRRVIYLTGNAKDILVKIISSNINAGTANFVTETSVIASVANDTAIII